MGSIRVLSFLCITGLFIQASCKSHGEEPVPSQPVATPTPSQAQEPASAPGVALIPDATSPIDAALVAATTSDSHDAAQSSGVYFVLGDWSGSLSERRVRSALRRVNNRLWACADKHDGYGSYEISYRLNASPPPGKTLKGWRWVYPIEVSGMQASSDRAVQCINYALSQQNHFMRKYKQARVSGTLSIVK